MLHGGGGVGVAYTQQALGKKSRTTLNKSISIMSNLKQSKVIVHEQ